MKKNLFLILCSAFIAIALIVTLIACNDITSEPSDDVFDDANVTPGDNNVMPEESELRYSTDTDGKGVTVIGYSDNIGMELVIPDAYNGLPVTAIGENAFRDCRDVISITIPDSVDMIYSEAFAGCTQLNEITLSKNVEHFAQNAFLDCDKLETVYYSGSAEDWCGIYFQNANANPLNYADILYANGSKLTDLEISGGTRVIKDYAFAGYDGLRSLTIETDLDEIGERVFNGCTNIESVKISGYITESGFDIFGGCVNIKEIEMSVKAWNDLFSLRLEKLEKVVFTGGEAVSVGMFKMYPELEVVILCDSIKSIGVSAFEKCSSLKEVRFGNSLNYIGDSAFEGCENLGNIVIPDSVHTIGDRAFYGSGAPSIKIGNGVNTIGAYTFAANDRLALLEIPASVTQISDGAFNGCTQIVEIFNRSALDIVAGAGDNGKVALYAKHVYSEEGGSYFSFKDDYGFYYDGTDAYLINYCGDRTELVLPSGFTASDGTEINSYKIYNYAFRRSDELTYVSVPDCVTEIGVGAFSFCENLSVVRLGNGISAIKQKLFDGCQKLTVMVIPSSVTVIESDAFRNCDNLASVTIPDSVNVIESQAFSSCDKLPKTENGVQYVDKWAISCDDDITQLTLRNDTVGIAGGAFSSKVNLISVVIPDSVKYLGEYAIASCAGLTFVTVGSNVESIGTTAFYKCYKLVEVYNKSSLNIVKDTSNGYVGYYAENIYTEEGGSRISDTEDGYRFYFDGASGWLLGYFGKETELTLPSGFTAYDGTAVDTYGVYERAFSNKQTMISITIPANVTSFGTHAFYGCNDLAVIRYEGSVADWCRIYFEDYDANPISADCEFYISGELIADLVIPDDVTSIGMYAFYGYLRLSKLTLGAGLSIIGEKAFYNCRKITEIFNKSALEIVAGANTYGYVAYYAKNVYTEEGNPAYTDTADGYRFQYYGTNGYLVTYYGSEGDITLPSYFIAPDGTQVNSYEINAYAFAYNELLTSVVVPDCVTGIGEGAFYHCKNLSSLTVGKGVANIGAQAFNGCGALTEIEFNAVNLEKYVMSNWPFFGAGIDGNGLTVTFGDSVESIPYGLMGRCLGLTTVIISDNVKSIGNYAFENCINLTVVTIGSGVTSIGRSAFEFCERLRSVVIPVSVTSIGQHAFNACSLSEIIFESTDGWQASTSSSFVDYTTLASADLANTSSAATYLNLTYCGYYWRRVEP